MNRPPYEAEIFHFCLPNGASKKKLTRSNSGSSLNELLFGQVRFFLPVTIGENFDNEKKISQEKYSNFFDFFQRKF